MSSVSRLQWVPAVLGATFAVACGGERAQPTPGVSGDTITIGAIVPLSDAVAAIGVPMAAGMRVYFDDLNARGGIAGRYQVRLLVEDQTYANPSTSAQKYQKIKDQVALFGMVVGTDHVNMLLPLLAEDRVMLVPATFDAEWVREPMLFPFSPPYQIWAMNGAGYFLAEGRRTGKTVCAAALATGYGEAGVEGLTFGAERLGYTIGATVRFKQDDQDFVAPITQLRNARCDAVVLVSLPAVTGRVLGTAAQMGFAPQWILLSPGWHGTMVESPLRDYLVKNAWVAYDGQAWGDPSEGMAQLLDATARLRPEQKPDIYYSVGWAISILVEALLAHAVERGDLSRDGIMRASETVGRISTRGFSGEYTYGPAATREPPRGISIFRVDPSAPTGLRTMVTGYETTASREYKIESRRP